MNFRSMKVLMVLDREFPPDIRVENEIEALSDAGYEVHIACFTMVKKADYEIINGVHIHRKKISGLTHKTSVGCLKYPFYFNFWRSFVLKLNKEYHFNSIHIHDLPLAQIGYEIKKKYGIPFFLDLHENWPAYLRIAEHTKSLIGKFLSNNNQWTDYEIKQCSNADSVIVVVEEAKKRLVSEGILPDKIIVVSNTLNIKHYSIPKESPDKNLFTLTYAGGINKHRGLQYIIKSLKFLKDSSIKIRLIILGDGSYLNNLKELSLTEGVNDMVDFAGWKQYEEMQKFIGLSNICLIPHEKNDHTDSTIPHKLFQYMYAGKPVLASDCTPIKRIVEDSKCGLIYKFDNIREIASKIQQIMNDKEMYNKMSVNGITSVKNKYNWEFDKNRLLSIYRMV